MALDRRYLNLIARPLLVAGRSGSRPLRQRLSEPRDAIEEIIEPYLIQQGFIQRTPTWAFTGCQSFCAFGPWRCRIVAQGAPQMGLFAEGIDDA